MRPHFIRTVLFWTTVAGLGVANSPAASFGVSLNNQPDALASAILGAGVTIAGTPVLSAQPGQTGLFTDFSSGPYTQTGGSSGMYSVSSGVILTTGIASGAEGSYIGGPSFDASGPGDAALSALAGGPTFDAASLTIQFTSTNPTLTLNFAFASAEYPGFVGTSPVDPFGIFLNGSNVAVVPGTTTPISINSVNATSNANFFTQYSTPATPFNYGGVTTLFSQTLNVSTSSLNTLRLAVADAGDGSLDSALLIQGASAGAVPEPSASLLFLAGAAVCGMFLLFRNRQPGQAK